MEDLFKKNSSEKIRNSDRLDKTITISSPMSWLALVGVVLIIVSVVVWGFLGEIPETITISGIIASPENSWAVSSKYAGRFEKYLVTSGQEVKVGDDIAVIILDNGNKETVKSDVDGVVSFLLFDDSDLESMVGVGSEIVRITPASGSNDVIAFGYLPVSQSSFVNLSEKDYKVTVSVLAASGTPESYEAEIICKSDSATDLENNRIFVSGQSYAQFNGVPSVAVICRFDDSVNLSPGLVVTEKIEIGKIRPVDKLPFGLRSMEGM